MPTQDLPQCSLLDHERLAFAGLTRVLVRADGIVSPEELDAIERVFTAFFSAQPQGLDAYREPAGTREGGGDEAAVWLQRAARELTDDEAVQRAALAVVRPEAREAIHEAMYELAAADVIAQQEWPLLAWLAEAWSLTERST